MFGTVAYSQAQSLTLEAKHQTVAPATRFDSEMSVKQVRGVQSELCRVSNVKVSRKKADTRLLRDLEELGDCR